MLTIYKYPLKLADSFTELLPSKRRILKVDFQAGTGPCLWALVDKGAELELVTFFALWTGNDIESSRLDETEYIGSLQAAEGMVWHVFQKLTDSEVLRRLVNDYRRVLG